MVGDFYEVYDINIEIWISFLSVVLLRCYVSVVSFKGKIYVFGYFQNDEILFQVYDIDRDKWELCVGYECFFNDRFWRICIL